MLINFSFSNFRSFRDRADFSMIAGRGRQHLSSLQKMPDVSGMNVLPLCAIFGGNASGKSNFVKALSHMQKMILSGKIETEPFKLDPEFSDAPSEFVICALANERVWEYSLSVRNKEIEEESLLYMRKKKEVQVFHRTRNSFSVGESVNIPEESRTKLQLIGETLAPGSIFLHAAQTYRLEGLDSVFSPIYNWFRDTLCIVSANSKRAALGVELLKNLSLYSDALTRADTGIDELKLTEVNPEQLNIDPSLLEKFRQSEANVIFHNEDSTLVLVKKDDGIHAYRCLSMHRDNTGKEVPFLFTEESDGSRRLLHLLPILIDHEIQPRVYVVDELDRSLHTGLSRYLVEQQLEIAETDPRNRQQLIFTTHDVMLMDRDLLRTDEMWAVERNRDHGSRLISFEDFIEIHRDKNIRNSYLTGHMGGLPRINL